MAAGSKVNVTGRSPRTLSSWWQALVDNNTGLVVSGPVRHGQCAAEACFGMVACPRAGSNNGAVRAKCELLTRLCNKHAPDFVQRFCYCGTVRVSCVAHAMRKRLN